MTADYNLLILGATPAAIALAQQARRWQARVALIYLPESWGAIDRDRLLMRCLLKSTSVPEALASGQALYERLELLQGPIALQQQELILLPVTGKRHDRVGWWTVAIADWRRGRSGRLNRQGQKQRRSGTY